MQEPGDIGILSLRKAEFQEGNAMTYNTLTDFRADLAARYQRVREVLVRADTSGMTRPARDPDERAFLAARGELGPFREAEPKR